MRTQHNPLREQAAPYEIKETVLLVVTHLPCEQEPGYHKDRMEVVQTCLTTMRERAGREHTFFVWDNGSNETFRDWLRHIFEPDILVESHNIGKNQARAAAIGALPLDTIVAYSDDDIYFEENWLAPQLDLLVTFPHVAAVSGMPIRTMMRWGNENTLKWAREHAKVKQGRFIPQEWEFDYADSIGRSHEDQIQITLKDTDYKIQYEGREAYAAAHHAQFIGYVVKVLPAMRASLYGAMPDEKPTDIMMDRTGLRLCTVKRLCRHIGNVLDESFKQ